MTKSRDTADSINRIDSSAADATAITIDANENVGIGTSSPEEALHVYNSTANINAVIESGDANAYLAFKDNSTTGYAHVFLGASGDDMTFFSGGSTERMRIDSAGSIETKGSSFGLISNAQQPTTTLANNAAINLTISGTATAGGGILCVYEPSSGESAIYHVGYNRGNLISNSDGSLFATGTTSGKNTIQVSGHQITFTNRTGTSRGYVFNLFIAGGDAYNQ